MITERSKTVRDSHKYDTMSDEVINRLVISIWFWWSENEGAAMNEDEHRQWFIWLEYFSMH